MQQALQFGISESSEWVYLGRGKNNKMTLGKNPLLRFGARRKWLFSGGIWHLFRRERAPSGAGVLAAGKPDSRLLSLVSLNPEFKNLLTFWTLAHIAFHKMRETLKFPSTRKWRQNNLMEGKWNGSRGATYTGDSKEFVHVLHKMFHMGVISLN